MPSGGARNRSGPQPTEGSRDSDRKGFTLTALPPAGYAGEVPDFPLPRLTVMRWEFEDKAKYQVVDSEACERTADRERELWSQLWTYPVACAWSTSPWLWNTIGMYVRTFVICEGSNATAADKGALHRFADQVGMTQAGRTELGWKIAEPKPEKSPAGPVAGATVTSIKNRLPRGTS